MENTTSILEKYKGSVPVSVIEIADDLGIKVYETEDLSDFQSGLIQKEDENFVIYVNANHAATRKNFTIAHEISHFILHKDKIGSGHVTSTRQPLKREDNPELTEEQKAMEIEANKLASEILMPEERFREVWDKASCIEEVARAFRVSVSAAAIRGDKLFRETFI